MTDPNPYQPVPMDIPAGHPLLDTAGFTDAHAVAEGGLSLAAALEVIKGAGYTVAEATAAHDQAMATLRSSREPAVHRCHRCQAPATVQWPRYATADEAEAWHAGREQHIRAANDGREAAGYVSDRTDTVTLAVHGCDEHQLPSPGLVHDADCGGHGLCRCVIDGGELDDAQREQLAEQQRAHVEVFEAAREANRSA